MDLLTSREGWCRVGGRRLTFVATYAELQDLIEDCLHDSEGPWALTGSDKVRRGPRLYDAVPWACDHIRLEECAGPEGRRMEVWLRSKQWTPELPSARAGHHYDTLCGWNGLIGLQRLGATHRDGCEVSLHLVDRIRDSAGIRDRAYPDYRRVFERLRRRVRSSATAITRVEGRDGQTWEDETVRWLPCAVETYMAGGDFPLRPAV